MAEAGSAAWPAGAASTQRDRGNLQSFLGFDPTGPRRMGAAWLGSGQAIYSLVDSFSRTGLVAVVRRSWVLGKQSTVLWTASVERDPATPCSLGPTMLCRSVDATLLRPVESAVQLRSACYD